MVSRADDIGVPLRRDTPKRSFWRVEDWWAIVVGLGLVVVSVAVYRSARGNT